MRLGLAVLSAAVVVGGYTLVNTIQSRPADSEPGAATAGETLRSWMPGAIDEPAVVEPRSFELIRFLNPDGSFGMVDDPRRVPPGATILGRERKQVAAAKPAPARPAPAPESESEELVDPALPPPGAGRRLSAAERRVMRAVLESGVMPDAKQLEQMQGDLDALEAEREAAR